MATESLKNYLNSIFVCSLLFFGSGCSTDESLEDVVLEEASISVAKSSKSIELSISDVSAEVTKSGYPASNVLDGSTSTRWSGKGDSVDFFINLETESLIDYLNIAFPSGSSRVYGYVIYTSSNASNWTKVKDSQSSGETTAVEEIDVTNSTGKYIKIVLEGSNVNTWNYISKLEVYGTPGEDDEENEEVEEVTTVTNGTVDFGSLEVETSWISEDQGDRDTFEASDVDGEEWMDVNSSGVVTMKCLAEDSHRTELKEKSGDEASLNTYKKMSYTATLVDVPENGVTIAQIHNRGGVNRPWIRVYVDYDGYIKIKETDTTPDESKSTYTVYEGPEYNSGDEISVTVTTENKKASFKIITNGNTLNETITPSEDWDDFSDSYYLKAGVYTEGDDTEPQMEFSSFSLDY